jgi:tRNA U34 5-carboxymethylaminomethyl modifying GTPase MnmE/TrmE
MQDGTCGEFTYRANINGKIDLSRAEAIAEHRKLKSISTYRGTKTSAAQ